MQVLTIFSIDSFFNTSLLNGIFLSESAPALIVGFITLKMYDVTFESKNPKYENKLSSFKANIPGAL